MVNTSKNINPVENYSPPFIVTIGGSAGGLEAFEIFFSTMPSDAGLGFVVLSHFDPHHKPMMPEILQRSTKMTVMQAEDGQRILPDHVYILPPNMDMSILQGSIQLLERKNDSPTYRLPIDFFLRQIAKDQGEKAIAVIVSGMGTDGTLGIQAIKDNYGMTIAQSPDSAKYTGMPSSAIASGFIDFILPINQIPNKILDYVENFNQGIELTFPQKETDENPLQKIFILLRTATGHDFSQYKKNTILRRIERRILIYHLQSFQQYVSFLQENPLEIKLLFNELLIGVTNFFRDGPVFEDLKKVIKSHVLINIPFEGYIRVWVPGCSTGEEAYSVAILLHESLQEKKLLGKVKLQIFATDINEEAVNKARLGRYPANISADISHKRLKKYFIEEEDHLTVIKEIREYLVFASQNFIMEPPFTKLDLLCCRNVLIYLNRELQKKIINLFHYALKSEGVLMLGTSESIDGTNEIFKAINVKSKLFMKIGEYLPTGDLSDLPYTMIPTPHAVKSSLKSEISIQTHLTTVLLDKFAPPSIIVNEKGNILYISGKTGEFLEPTPGKAIMNIFNMAREGLKFELGNALYQIFKNNSEIFLKNVKIQDTDIILDVLLQKFVHSESFEPLALIIFQKKIQKKEIINKGSAKRQLSGEKPEQYEELHDELKSTRERLQITIEEMQTSQEELKSSNEELQATNEELQSTNEELKTSKEELKSLNEELITVNSELHSKIEKLSTVNDDMKNVLNSIDTAVIFVDNDLKIKNFTQKASKIVNLIQNDIGRPISHISSVLKYDNFISDIQEVLETLVYKEIEVESNQNKWFSLRIMPYRTSNNIIDGLVIRFNDITDSKFAQDSLFFHDQIESETEMIIKAIDQPVVCLDLNLNVIYSNDAFLRTFSVSDADITHNSIFSIAEGIFDTKGFQMLNKNIERRTDIIFNFYVSLQNNIDREFQVKLLASESKRLNFIPYRVFFTELYTKSM